MKKYLVISIAAICLFFASCRLTNNDFNTETKYFGYVTTSDGEPIDNIKVLVYNESYNEQHYKTKTDSTGYFETIITLEETTSGCKLMLDGGGSHIKYLELKGSGRDEYNYGTIKLYNSQLESLPQISYMGKTYYIYPTLNGKVNWESALTACQNLEQNYECDDWQLPSEGVLEEMYVNKDSIGGFLEEKYWSKEASPDGKRFYYMDFATGEYLFTENNDTRFRVRPVRTNSGSDINEPIPSEGYVTEITTNSAKYAGNILSDGGSAIIERGVCWSLSEEPSVADNFVSAGTGIGEFTCQITNLQPQKTYHVRAYAKNQAGKERYGSEFVFETKAVEKPEVATVGVSNITENSAIIEGNVISDGGSTITERGICYSTNENPTINDHYCSAGTGSGEFTCMLTDLQPQTLYYVRAYAKNASGKENYGSYISFETSVFDKPHVATLGITNITQNKATIEGNVISDEGSAVTERGVCWSKTSQEPTISGSHASSGAGLGQYSVTINNLEAGTRYYVRAYATNAADTGYGEVKEFNTLSDSGSDVFINEITSHWTTYAVCNVVVNWNYQGEIEYGVCWSESGTPTIENNHLSHTVNPSGSNLPHSSTYDFMIDGLTPGTTYNISAYAIDNEGQIIYSTIEQFTTTN